MVAPVVIASAGLGMLAGVAMANRSMGDGLPAASRWDARPRCATCGGSGRVECLCNRWSDGDSGCRTCAGSGRMPPLPARLTVQHHKPPPPAGHN
ncbi:hypothetical protein HU200_041856 [Digitaria exilis]|uniref:Uncharacterized protein n=1 Tax=Digitaria exilis TaxID=1010633 RepID=A0A835BBW1_9POAL|nr:hypothetical protein HU200_041856 [Digitaria exilis]